MEKFHIMLKKLPEMGRKDFHPKPAIEDSHRGVEFDFYYTGKRLGSGTLLELHITSIIRDWEENIFLRKSWYNTDRKFWKDLIRDHIQRHLLDLGVDNIIALGLLRDFEVKEEHFRAWDKYDRKEI